MEQKEIKTKIEDSYKPRTWVLVILIVFALAIVVVLANKIITNRKERGNIFSDITNSIKEQIEKIEADDEIDNEIEDEIDDFASRRFNGKFELYSGTEWGSSVGRLLDNVITNNKKEKNHIIVVKYNDFSSDDPTEIKELKKKFDDWTKYEVSLDYDRNNFVDLVTIEDL